MDENRSNIRLVKTGGRKVTKTTTEYDWDSLDRKGEKRSDIDDSRRTMTDLEKRIRYQKQQKHQRLKVQRIRAAVILAFTVIVVSVLLFLTPIFNIKTVMVEGNNLVTAEQFQEKLKPLVGENLFRTGSGKIRKTLKTIPYIDTVDVQKKIFPPSVKVTVTEYVPAAIMRVSGKNLLVNSGLIVLSDSGDAPVTVPVVTGCEVKEYKLSETVRSDETEKMEILTTILSTIESTGIVDKVVEINVSDISNITLNYDNRITVLCGTKLDLERKLRLFKETLTSGSLEDNVRGTMDLTESKKAIFNRE